MTLQYRCWPAVRGERPLSRTRRYVWLWPISVQRAHGRVRPGAVGHGPPKRSQKSIEVAVQVAETRRLNLLRLDAYKRGQGSRPPASRRCRRRLTPSTSRPPIRRPAHPSLRVRPAHRLVTPTVHRPPRTTPGRRAPAVAKRTMRARLLGSRSTRTRGYRGPAAAPERLSLPSARARDEALHCSQRRVRALDLLSLVTNPPRSFAATATRCPVRTAAAWRRR